MFRCSECGTEFDVKPQFCDCGNDIFEEVVKDSSEENFVDEKQNPQQDFLSRNELSDNKDLKRFSTEDYVSIGIFLLCIIMSVIIIFADWKIFESKQPVMDNKTKTENVQTTKIPSLDSFWNNSVAEVNDTKQELKEDKKFIEIPKPVVKLMQEPIKRKIEIVPSGKPQPVQKKKVTVVSKPQTSTSGKSSKVKTNTQQVDIDLQKILKNANSKVKTSSQPETKQIKQVQASTRTVTPVSNSVQSVNKVVQKQELANYKIGLRNTIGRKIDFTRVVGDGTCTVAFKVNSSGTLTNRSFSVQSSNITLNDAVYNAVMSTPSYSAPPAGYNNETMYLKISFTNGNFNISLY